jgi:hypothetical protein
MDNAAVDASATADTATTLIPKLNLIIMVSLYRKSLKKIKLLFYKAVTYGGILTGLPIVVKRRAAGICVMWVTISQSGIFAVIDERRRRLSCRRRYHFQDRRCNNWSDAF